jgi:phosphomannomutase
MLNSTIFREWSSSAGPSGPIGSARTAAFDAVNGTGGPVMHRILERLNADAIEMFFGEVKCSQAMYDDLAARGGNPIMWKTGHSLIKAKMQECHAELAGEMSGHMFFADRY